MTATHRDPCTFRDQQIDVPEVMARLAGYIERLHTGNGMAPGWRHDTGLGDVRQFGHPDAVAVLGLMQVMLASHPDARGHLAQVCADVAQALSPAEPMPGVTFRADGLADVMASALAGFDQWGAPVPDSDAVRGVAWILHQGLHYGWVWADDLPTLGTWLVHVGRMMQQHPDQRPDGWAA